MGIDCVCKENLKSLTRISHFVSELANLSPDGHQSYVGKSAFTHKGGMHVSAISRDKRTYEHIDPELVGNKRRVLVSELAGRSNVLYKLKDKGLGLEESALLSKKIVARVKE